MGLQEAKARARCLHQQAGEGLATTSRGKGGVHSSIRQHLAGEAVEATMVDTAAAWMASTGVSMAVGEKAGGLRTAKGDCNEAAPIRRQRLSSAK